MGATLKDNSTKREGGVRVRSSRGIPVLEETYHFIVVADQVNEPYLSVISATGLPRVNRTFSPSGLCRCKTISAERDTKNPLIWNVRADFSSEVEQNSQKDSGNDLGTPPTTWTPIYETKFERLQEVSKVDKSGDPIVNSAGQVFPEGITLARMIPVWDLFQFESAFTSDLEIISRSETVNSKPFRGLSAGTLLLVVLSSVVGFYYGQTLRLTQYAVKYNRKNWKHKRLDVGTAYLSSGDLLAYTDADENVILGGLDGSGGKVTLGDPPAVLEFDEFEEQDFNQFLRF